jgi:hypothetical protein
MQEVEPGQSRCKPERGKGRGRSDRECFLATGDAIDGGIQLRQRFVGDAIQLFARRGQLQPAIDTPEQGLAELVLQGLDPAADCRLRNAELLRCACEAEVTRSGLKTPQEIERQTQVAGSVHPSSACKRYGVQRSGSAAPARGRPL